MVRLRVSINTISSLQAHVTKVRVLRIVRVRVVRIGAVRLRVG